uniref:Uncharacterized protein n=1 Tax=Globodera rostochiensis TaxID=31243 RepID=A0A914I934_GLORO
MDSADRHGPANLLSDGQKPSTVRRTRFKIVESIQIYSNDAMPPPELLHLLLSMDFVVVVVMPWQPPVAKGHKSNAGSNLSNP